MEASVSSHERPDADLDAARGRVAAAAGRLAAAGLVVGTAGNLSERVGELVAITPTGARLADLRPQDVAVVDLDGTQVGGGLRPTSELDLHLGVYRRYGSGAVVHTHSPHATAVACAADALPLIHYAMLGLGGAVRVAPYRTFGTPELAEVTLEALADRTAALMAGHGAITHGPDLAAAEAATELLEWAAALYLRAATLGPPRTLSEQEAAAVRATVTARGYGAPQAAP
jgi:L-fuculose-phosphate aldolase